MEERKSWIEIHYQSECQTHNTKNSFSSWEKCKSYCSWKLSNKTCGRIDDYCRNLSNCDEQYQADYKIAHLQAQTQEMLEQIEKDNEAISHIY